MAKLREDIERWGLWPVLSAVCMRRLERHLGLHAQLEHGGPDELSLSVGVSVDITGKVLVGAEGSLRVQVKWKARP